MLLPYLYARAALRAMLASARYAALYTPCAALHAAAIIAAARHAMLRDAPRCCRCRFCCRYASHAAPRAHALLSVTLFIFMITAHIILMPPARRHDAAFAFDDFIAAIFAAAAVVSSASGSCTGRRCRWPCRRF